MTTPHISKTCPKLHLAPAAHFATLPAWPCTVPARPSFSNTLVLLHRSQPCPPHEPKFLPSPAAPFRLQTQLQSPCPLNRSPHLIHRQHCHVPRLHMNTSVPLPRRPVPITNPAAIPMSHKPLPPTWYTASMAMRRASTPPSHVPSIVRRTPSVSQLRVTVVRTPAPALSKRCNRSGCCRCCCRCSLRLPIHAVVGVWDRPC